jgi:hypothetical protein
MAGFGAEDAPYRLSDHLGLDGGFKLSGSQRTRYETLTNNVRAASSKNDQLLAFQTILRADYSTDSVRGQLELMDSRQALADSGSIIGNTEVNTLDILQANVQTDFNLADGTIENTVKIGRYTSDLGARRLMARNRFRNAINAFDGVELSSRWESGMQLRSFYAQPVNRLPADFQSILDNEFEADDSSNGTRIVGVHLSVPELANRINGEFFLLDLKEKDTRFRNTRNRNFYTAGLRLLRPPRRGELDFDLEAIVQNGTQRESTAAVDLRSLDHKAGFGYLSAGYTFDVDANTRLLLEYDQASGDKNPFDGESNRFDSLYGVSVFAYGPGSLYGVFSRSNISSPGLRLFSDPLPNLNVMASYRRFWLDSSTDSWGRTGYRDRTGATDDYVGEHLELRLRWTVLPGNLMIEIASVFLNANGFSDENSRYAHIAAVFTY